jgi:long-chain fatty acid transport protein
VPALTLAADVSRINYSEIAAIGNASSAQAQLGADKGPGFGWQDVKIVKLGLQWRSSDNLTLRAGVNKGGNPIRTSDVSFNILAPGVTTTHYTLGATWRVAGGELTGAYMKSPRNTVTGASLFNGLGLPAGNETIGMSQSSVGLAWGWAY